MLRSMTGFGRGVVEAPFGKLTVEIQSVNRKYLEVFISTPKEFSRFEHEIRKQVSEVVLRGSVSLRLIVQPNASAIGGFIPDPLVLKELKKNWEKISEEVGFDRKAITLSFLMENFPTVSKVESASDDDLTFIIDALKNGLKELTLMKEAEGKAIFDDLKMRLNCIEKLLKKIEELSPDASLKMRERLFQKMEEFLKGNAETDERLTREVALFSERVDITEEITRFKSHLTQFRAFLEGSTVGRKMDFLIQEFGREINTIGSKSMDAQISHLVVEIKAELEKMREQVQNLE